MRWGGLAKAGLQIRFPAIVYHIKRCARILAAAELPLTVAARQP
jgi:hypothetical protein